MRRGALDACLRDALCGSSIGTCKSGWPLHRDRAKAIFLRCSPHGHAKDFPCVAKFRPNALNVRLRNVQQRPMRSTCVCAMPAEVDALTRVCAVLLIVALAPHGGRKGQENYTASRALILGVTPVRRDTQRERMPGSPSERCIGRRRANWSWCS